jgi:ABC-type branched-subunit amino acid transport system substrate-binding protein
VRRYGLWNAAVAVLAVVSTLVVSTLVVSAQAAGSQSGELRVAILVPSHGFFAVHNALLANGAEIAAQESGRKGPVGTLKISLVREAIAAEPSSAEVMASLSERGIDVVILPCNVDSVPALARAGAQRKLLMLSPCTPDPRVASSTPMLWPTAMTGTAEAAQLLSYARGDNATTAYMLTSTRPGYTRAMSTYLRRAAALNHIKLLGLSTVGLDGGNLGDAVKKIKRAQPNIILTAIPSPYVEPIVAGLRAQGVILPPVYATDGMDADLQLAKYGEVLQGTYYGSFGYERPEGRQFEADYQAAFRKEPLGSFPRLGYETIRILAAAADHADSTSPRSMNAAFQNGFSVTGVALGDVTYLRGTKIPVANAAMGRIVYGSPYQLFSGLPPRPLPSP